GPGVIAAIALVLARYGLVIVNPDFSIYAMLGSLACAAVIALWWLLLSRAPWIERLGAFIVVVIAFYATRPFLDKSISGGMVGMMVAPYSLPPVLAPALLPWGGGPPPPLGRPPARHDGCDDLPGVRRLAAPTHRRHHGQRFPDRVAVRENAGAAASGDGGRSSRDASAAGDNGRPEDASRCQSE